MATAGAPHWVEHPTVSGIYTIDRGTTLDVVIEVDTSPFDAAMATVDESLRRIEQAQAFATWSLANDPTRLWHQRRTWAR